MASGLALNGVHIAGKPKDSLWDIKCHKGCISSIGPHLTGAADGRLVTPSLCHPHIHLDKCFLLQHPKYKDLEITHGDFAEAMMLTSIAKSRFNHDDLMERGKTLIEESISYGVTHMRAFVEVDSTVGMKCLDAGLQLKEDFKDKCYVQICAFAQDPILSQKDGGDEMRNLLKMAAERRGVDVLGSTPYVEVSQENQADNIRLMVSLATAHGQHLDFHLDYNLDSEVDPSVHTVIRVLKDQGWPNGLVVTLGHCTRLTLFRAEEWRKLQYTIGDLPISFIGLPTSDLFMMSRPEADEGGGARLRGTLQIPQMIKEYGLQAAIGINNVGNAFTPQGSCDPLSIASLGVGIYQAGTKEDAEILLQCISTRARAAIGLGSRPELEIKEGGVADFVAFGATGSQGFRHPRAISDLVHDACRERTTVYRGAIVSN